MGRLRLFHGKHKHASFHKAKIGQPEKNLLGFVAQLAVCLFAVAASANCRRRFEIRQNGLERLRCVDRDIVFQRLHQLLLTMYGCNPNTLKGQKLRIFSGSIQFSTTAVLVQKFLLLYCSRLWTNLHNSQSEMEQKAFNLLSKSEQLAIGGC